MSNLKPSIEFGHMLGVLLDSFHQVIEVITKLEAETRDLLLGDGQSIQSQLAVLGLML